MREAIGCGLLVAMALSGVLVVTCSLRQEHIAERLALDDYWRGSDAFDRGDYDRAIDGFREYRRWQRDSRRDDSHVTASIAECLCRLGQHEEAMRAFDESLAARQRWSVCVQKAQCMDRRHPGSGLDWLQITPIREELRLQALSSYYRQVGRYDEACVSLRALLELRAAYTWFVDGKLDDREPLSEFEHNSLVDVVETFDELAWCELQRGELRLAEDAARKGLAGHQLFLKHAGYSEPARVEAGSLPCRLVLARIATRHEDWESARSELEHAEHLAGPDDASHYQSELRRLRAMVQERR